MHYNFHFTTNKEEDIHELAKIKSSENFGMGKLADFNMAKIVYWTAVNLFLWINPPIILSVTKLRLFQLIAHPIPAEALCKQC